MAVRFDADGEDYSRSLALGAQANYTVTCWVVLRADRNSWQTPWSLDNGSGDVDVLQTDVDGTSMELYSDGNNPLIVAMTVGTWYFIGVSRAGTGGTGYHKTAAASSLSTVSLAGSSSSTNMANLRIGESPFGGEWLNGCVAGLKFWTAALTQAEIELEASQYAPNRIVNLQAFYPFVRAETTDYSGNGRTLSGGSGTTTEDGPPIPWRITSPRIVLPAAGGGGIAATGRSTVGLAGAGAASKVGATGGPAQAGFAGTGAARKIAAVSGTCSLGLGGSGVAAKRTAVAGLVVGGLAANSQATKKTAQAGAVPSGLAGVGAATAVHAQSGSATLGVIGDGAAAKQAPTGGAAAAGLEPTGAAAKRAAQEGIAPLGLVSLRAGTASRAQGGSAGLGIAASGTAAKLISAAGSAPLGLAGTRSGVAARAVSGACGFGLGTVGLSAKVAVETGAALLGAGGAASPRKVAATRGAGCFGVVSGGVATKTAPGSGTSPLGLFTARVTGFEPPQPTPPERSFVVTAENRATRIVDDRSYAVAVENRTVEA